MLSPGDPAVPRDPHAPDRALDDLEADLAPFRRLLGDVDEHRGIARIVVDLLEGGSSPSPRRRRSCPVPLYGARASSIVWGARSVLPSTTKDLISKVRGSAAREGRKGTIKSMAIAMTNRNTQDLPPLFPNGDSVDLSAIGSACFGLAVGRMNPQRSRRLKGRLPAPSFPGTRVLCTTDS